MAITKEVFQELLKMTAEKRNEKLATLELDGEVSLTYDEEQYVIECDNEDTLYLEKNGHLACVSRNRGKTDIGMIRYEDTYYRKEKDGNDVFDHCEEVLYNPKKDKARITNKNLENQQYEILTNLDSTPKARKAALKQLKKYGVPCSKSWADSNMIEYKSYWWFVDDEGNLKSVGSIDSEGIYDIEVDFKEKKRKGRLVHKEIPKDMELKTPQAADAYIKGVRDGYRAGGMSIGNVVGKFLNFNPTEIEKAFSSVKEIEDMNLKGFFDSFNLKKSEFKHNGKAYTKITVNENEYVFDKGGALKQITTSNGNTYRYNEDKQIIRVYQGEKPNRTYTNIPSSEKIKTPQNADIYLAQKQQEEKEKEHAAALAAAEEKAKEYNAEREKLESKIDAVYVPFVDKNGQTQFVKLQETDISDMAKQSVETGWTTQRQNTETVIIQIGENSYVMSQDEFTKLTAAAEDVVDAKKVRDDMKDNRTRLAKQTQSAIWQDRYGRRWSGSYSVGGPELVDELASRQVIKTGRFGLRQWVETKTYKTGHKTAAKEKSTLSMSQRLQQIQPNEGK